MHKFENGSASLMMRALDEASYQSPYLLRWSSAARRMLLHGKDGTANEYIKLALAEFDKIAASMVEVRRVLDAAPVQEVSHETNKEAA